LAKAKKAHLKAIFKLWNNIQQHKNQMPEHQNKVYKQIWHDDYLKWICGFVRER